MSDAPERIRLGLKELQDFIDDPLWGDGPEYIRADLIPLDIEAAIEEAHNQQERVEELERIIERMGRLKIPDRTREEISERRAFELQRRWDDIPWERIEAYVKSEDCYPDETVAYELLRDIFKLRQPRYSE